MKKLIPILVTLLLMGRVSHAGVLSLTADGRTGYVVGSGSRIVDTPFIEYAVRVSNDFGYAKLWAANSERGFEEIDYVLGHILSLSNTTTLDLSVNWWDVRPVGQTRSDIFAPAVELRHNVNHTTTFGAGAEWYMVLDRSNDSGMFGYLFTNTSWSIGSISADMHAEIGYDAAYNHDRWYAKVSIQPSATLGEHMQFRFLGATTWITEGKSPEWVGSLAGFSYTF